MSDNKQVQEFVSHDKKPPKQEGYLFMNFVFILLLALSVTFLMVLYIDRLPSSVMAGTIAAQDIRADQNYEIVDEAQTAKLKQEALLKALPVYDFDTNLVEDRKTKIGESFILARSFIEKYYSQKQNVRNKQVATPTDEQEEELRQQFAISLGTALSDENYKLIRKDVFSKELEEALLVAFESVQKKPIIQDTQELNLRPDQGIDVRVFGKNSSVDEKMLTDYKNILAIEDAKKIYGSKDVASLQKKLNLEFVDNEKMKLALRLYPEFIKVNFVLNKIETEARRERAQANVQNVIYKLQKGQIIVRRGDRYEQGHVTIIQGIQATRLQSNVLMKFAGVFLLVVASLLIVYQFALTHIRRFHPSKKDINFLGLLLILFLAILRLGTFLGSSVQDAVPFPVDVVTFYYLIPIAAGAMMIRTILNAETAFVFSVVISFFSGLFLESNYEITVYYFLSSLLAASIIGHVERRSSVLRRGLYLGFINFFLVLSLNLTGKISASSMVDVQAVITNGLFGFMGGILSALTLLAVSPMMEVLFNYTTNIQLLELANMNHPLLREMIVRAPGTYHHSQLVGILAEAGTRVIGGNALLARVGSYYHDIGKMKKPQYFIENQKGVNPHDNLVPSMSALIIDAHVKDGIEMAKEAKLPQVIADFIPEHQGTKLIGYFYHKALKLAEKDGTTVDERGFRYIGPRPQSRESGVVMMADTIEAAVRSMPDKSPQKIQAQVEKLVNQHFVDGQLDECDLTLRDLHLIAEAFVKILIGIYHQRVEYPQIGKSGNATVVSDSQSPFTSGNISHLFKEKN